MLLPYERLNTAEPTLLSLELTSPGQLATSIAPCTFFRAIHARYYHLQQSVLTPEKSHVKISRKDVPIAPPNQVADPFLMKPNLGFNRL